MENQENQVNNGKLTVFVNNLAKNKKEIELDTLMYKYIVESTNTNINFGTNFIMFLYDNQYCTKKLTEDDWCKIFNCYQQLR